MLDDLEVYQDINLTRERLHEQIADKIQQLITAQELQPGDRLPPDRKLAAMLNVSRPTVREALRLLQHRGLVTMKPGSGTYVTQMGSEPVVRSVERFFSARDCSFEHLMQVRELLEPGTAALAALHATPDDIEALRRGVEALEQAFQSGRPDQLALAESDFHTAVGNASGNPLLAAITASITHLVRIWTRESSTTIVNTDANRSHRMILQAILDRDPNRAREASELHTRSNRQVLLSVERGRRRSKPSRSNT